MCLLNTVHKLNFIINTILFPSPILHDRVEFSDPPFLNGTQRTVNLSDEQAFIDNLHPGVTYNFIVTAFNEIGFGMESEALPVTTLDEGTIVVEVVGHLCQKVLLNFH